MTGPEPVALPLGDTPSLQNTVAQAGVVFKLFAPELLGFTLLRAPLLLVAYYRDRLPILAHGMNNVIESFIFYCINENVKSR